MKIGVIGGGYVGLVTGACLAEFGHDIHIVDVVAQKIESLKDGQIPIFEPGLAHLMESNRSRGRIHFSTNIRDAVKDRDVVFNCVGTPSSENGEIDLSYVFQVVESLIKNIDSYTVLVTKSTVLPGTAEKIIQKFEDAGVSSELYDIVSNPEFLREGNAIDDFMKPDRVVIGANSKRAFDLMDEVYDALRGKTEFVHTNPQTSEMIKYAANAFLAVKISFINEIALMSRELSVDVETVAKAMGSDERISPQFLKPGPGYGGSCFPKDTLAIHHLSKEIGVESQIIFATIKTNDALKNRIAELFIRMFDNGVQGLQVAVLGLAFKAKTDDIRYSSAIPVLKELSEKGAVIRVYDPEASENMQKIFPDIEYCNSIEDVLKNADGCVLLTDWEEFKSLSPKYTASLMKGCVFFDSRNLFKPQEWRDLGFNFSNMGKQF